MSHLDPTNSGGLRTCDFCHNSFHPRRKDQKYCSQNCRKLSSQRQIRNERPINSRCSPTKWRTNYELFDLSRRLSEALYGLPVTLRLGYMKEIIDDAIAGNSQLRQLIANRYLQHPEEEWLHHRNCPPAYPTFSKAADLYCLKFWGASAAEVVYNRIDEPATGEVHRIETSSPYLNRRVEILCGLLPNAYYTEAKERVGSIQTINNNNRSKAPFFEVPFSDPHPPSALG